MTAHEIIAYSAIGTAAIVFLVWACAQLSSRLALREKARQEVFFLENVARYHGLERMPGETPDQLRRRLSARVTEVVRYPREPSS